MDASCAYSDSSYYDAEQQTLNPLFSLNNQFTTQRNEILQGDTSAAGVYRYKVLYLTCHFS